MISGTVNALFGNIEPSQAALDYISQNNLGSAEVPQDIAELLAKLRNKATLTEDDIRKFNLALDKLKATNPKLHDLVAGTMNDICTQIFTSFEEEYYALTDRIAKELRAGKPLSFPLENQLEKYKGLLNVYSLTKGSPIKPISDNGNFFPSATPLQKDMFKFEIPFAINTLMLMNKLPKNPPYCGVILSKPLYPEKMSPNESKAPQKRGIKESEDYYPFRRVYKIDKGDTGDKTYMATNGKKMLYVRGKGKEDIAYKPDAIFASKVARFISKENFASERLLNNRMAGSRHLGSYNVAASDRELTRVRIEYIEMQKNVIPGTGTVDEVLNFIQETDSNIENFGFSLPDGNKRDLSKSHVCKIDYDFCKMSKPINISQYESNILSRSQVYSRTPHAVPHVTHNEGYINEKLHARFKLALLSDKILGSMADKAYLDPNQKANAVNEAVNRTNMALELFLKHNQAKAFLVKNPAILLNVHKEGIEYINAHFDENQRKVIIDSFEARISHVRNEVKDKLGVKLKDPIARPGLLADFQRVMPSLKKAKATPAPVKAPEPPHPIPPKQPTPVGKAPVFVMPELGKMPVFVMPPLGKAPAQQSPHHAHPVFFTINQAPDNNNPIAIALIKLNEYQKNWEYQNNAAERNAELAFVLKAIESIKYAKKTPEEKQQTLMNVLQELSRSDSNSIKDPQVKKMVSTVLKTDLKAFASMTEDKLEPQARAREKKPK